MHKRLLVYLVIILLTSFLYYFSINNLLLSLIVGVIGILSLILIEKKIFNYYKKAKKTHECIQFMNNFIITLSINKSILSTYEICSKSFSKELKQQDKLLSNLDVETRIHYLSKYFNNSTYEVFIKLLDQYIYNGGEILKISQILLFDARQLEEDIDNQYLLIIKKIFEFGSLWLITFIILVIIKFSLNDYFLKISNLDYFKYGLLGFFVFFYINTIFFVYNAFNLNFVKEAVKENNKKKVTKTKKDKKEKIKNVKIKRKNAFN